MRPRNCSSSSADHKVSYLPEYHQNKISAPYRERLTAMTMTLAQARLSPMVPTVERMRTRGPELIVDDLNSFRTDLRLF